MNQENSGAVLITGTSSGIGRATALAMRAAGFTTVATARYLESISQLQGSGCETVQLDVNDEESMQRAIQEVERRHGWVSILVNNAGYGEYGPVEEKPIEKIRRQFETNVFGLVRMCQLVLPKMRAMGGGRIINISSVAGQVGQPGGGIYHATKHAVEAISEALRAEVRAFGIDVVAIRPGPVATPFRDKLLPSIDYTGDDSPYHVFKQNLAKAMDDTLTQGHTGTLEAEEVAKVVVEAARSAKPSTSYNVGVASKMLPILRGLTPDRVWDAAFMHMVPAEASH